MSEKESRKRKMEMVPLKIGDKQISLLYPLLQKGVFIKVRGGCSVRALLCDQLNLDPDYVKDRIQTAFLNGKAVDDFDEAIVDEGSVLTLSGAMPGLAGATLRKGGYYRAMRASLTHGEEGRGKEKETGFIQMRIFNILLKELSPVFLAHGIYLTREDFDAFRAGLSIEERRDSPGK